MNKTLYYGGDIITMEEPLYAEAVLIENGMITAVGKLADLEKFAADASRYDLCGATMLPAFLDAHSHITAVAASLGMLSLEQAKNFEELAEMIRSYKEQRQIPEGEWITCFQYDHNNLAEKKHPDKALLDRAAPNNPVIIAHSSGHMGIVNTMALQILGVTEDTADPPGGKIGRQNGSLEPSGYLEETAFTALTSKVGQPSVKQQVKLIENAQNIYLRNGITTVQDGLTKRQEWNLLHQMAEDGLLKLDIVCYADLRDHKALLEENPPFVKQYRNRLKLGGYKIFLDGSPQGRTAWMTEPYWNGEAGYCGYPIYQDHQVMAFLRAAITEGHQILVHCNGDAAAEQLIRCYQRAAVHKRDIRPVMIHAQLVRADQLERMAKLSMIASFFVAHTYYWGDIHRLNFGDNRAKKISPVRTAMEKRVIYTFHQDSPVAEPNMMFAIWCAVNRISKEGIVMGKSECISPLDALRAVTIHAAYQYFEEDRKGSIRPGKLADFVLLDRNPLKANPMEIKDIKVVQTIKEGVNML